MTSTHTMPGADRDDSRVQGHWLLARLGKKVLRPGGIGLTRTLLRRTALAGKDVVELAPGLGRTATEILQAKPASYVGVDRDPDALAQAAKVVANRGTLVEADAGSTGLPDASADVVIGEAMLTMQGEGAKNAIVAEAARVLRPGGRYAIHELGMRPEDVSEATKTEVRQALARSIRVNARPQTRAEMVGTLGAARPAGRIDRYRTDGAAAAPSHHCR